MRHRKLLLALALLPAVLLVAAGGAFYWLASRGTPQRSGTAALDGLTGPVTVRWDRWAVPHVTAGSLADGAAALGWLHANDRLVQMELGRRAVRGRLAELFGEAVVGADRYHRRLRMREAAERLWLEAGAESRLVLEAYAAGVNAWLTAHEDDLPPELTLLGATLDPWTPVDSLGFVLMMGEDLSFWAGRPEEKRFRWLAAFGAERTLELMGEPHSHVPEAIWEMARNGGSPTGPAAEPLPAGSPGSNNWALAGRHTATGRPLLANDPHLGLGLPAVWYQVLLRAPGYAVAGWTLPGVPGVVIGRNAELAWAFTNTMLDDHDLFFERLDEAGERVERDGVWQPLEVERETIPVRDGDPVELVLRRTDHGPLLEADPEEGLPARSLAWTLHRGGDPISAFLHLGRTATVEAALEGLGGYTGPAQNLVLADREGSLAYTVLGRLPRRRTGDGRLPSPGWSPDYGWDGLLPRTANPTVVDPPEGLLVTANNDIRANGWAEELSADFDTPHRAERITELLRGRGAWDVRQMGELQTDVVSTYARRMVELLEPGAYAGDAAKARELLTAWEVGRRGEMRGAPGLVFALFERELREALFADEAEAHGVPSPGSREHLLAALEGHLDPAWFDDVSTPETEGRREVLEGALGESWRAALRLGSDPTDWRWEEHHPLTLGHPLGALPLIGLWLDRGPYPVPGSATTVAAFGGRWADGERVEVTFGPSMRWVVDLADPDGATAVLPGGQSGHPADPHYDDQVETYLAGEMRSVPWSEAAIEAATVSRLELVP